MKKEIIVLTERWVVIGDVNKFGDELEVSNASVIRYWGTKRGLGEIAIDGPTDKTILDFVGILRIPVHAVIFRIICQK